jgi:hypothetical protein
VEDLIKAEDPLVKFVIFKSETEEIKNTNTVDFLDTVFNKNLQIFIKTAKGLVNHTYHVDTKNGLNYWIKGYLLHNPALNDEGLS